MNQSDIAVMSSQKTLRLAFILVFILILCFAWIPFSLFPFLLETFRIWAS